jgi:hypothetical protein
VSDIYLAGQTEVQMLGCDANQGHFSLTFRGNTTRNIPFNSTGIITYKEFGLSQIALNNGWNRG